MECIFCKIRDGEIPSDFIYEDEKCFVIKDINPKAELHYLLIPKQHIESINKLEENDVEIIGHLAIVAKKLATKNKLKGYKLIFNVEKAGGQEIFHIHQHLLGVL